MKSIHFICMFLMLGAFSSCSQQKIQDIAPNGATTNFHRNDESISAHFRNRTDGTFYENVPSEYATQLNANWHYSSVHLFIQDDGRFHFIYEFGNEADRQNAGNECNQARVPESHPLFGTVNVCKNEGTACYNFVNAAGQDETHWCDK